MLQVDLHNILTEEDALQRIQDIFAHVENQKETYVVTKNGKPAFAIIDIERLEQTSNGVSMPEAPVTSPATAPAPTTTEPNPSISIMEDIPEATAAPILADTASPMNEPLPVEQPTQLVAQPQPEPQQPAPEAISQAQTPGLPPLNGSLDLPELPDMPEDPSNSSPLA